MSFDTRYPETQAPDDGVGISQPDVPPTLAGDFYQGEFEQYDALADASFHTRFTPPGYEIKQVLDRGAMGLVYLARHIKLDRLVALKQIRIDQHFDEASLKRFKREAQVTALLHHPNIIQVFEIGDHDGLPFISMEYCCGGSINRKLDGTPMKPVEAAALVETLSVAVQHAHRHDIIHRDLKPHNVLLTLDGTPKLTDFGIAKRLDDDHSDTLQGSILGTPAYMAPEQAIPGKEVGTAADVYGLGAILYELLTGRPPFKAATIVETIQQVADLDLKPVSPRRLQAATPKDLDTICLKCLEKVPSKRYASAAHLSEDLRRFRSGEPIRARALGRFGRFWRWCGRYPATASTIATALAVAIVFIFGVLSIAQRRADELRVQAVRRIASDARHVASTVLLRFQAVGAAVERAASRGSLRAMIRAGDRDGLRMLAKDLVAGGEVQAALQGSAVDPVASWMVMDPSGTILAVSHDEPLKKLSNPGRDYFHGAIEAFEAAGRPVIHVSRGYHSQNQGLDKFALSMVVADAENGGKPLGVLVVTMTTGASLGSSLQDSSQKIALALPLDTNDPGRPVTGQRPPAEYQLVVHPAYRNRQKPVQMPRDALPEELRIVFGGELKPPQAQMKLYQTNDYRDPAAEVDRSYGGRWWAGFAPVGNSEMVVIVQQSESGALEADQKMLRQLGAWAGGTLGVGLAFTTVLASIRIVQRRRRIAGVTSSLPPSPSRTIN
jgi:serine/threonine-protein kinase